DSVCQFEQTVGQCRLAMIYMRNDTKIPNMSLIHVPQIISGYGMRTKGKEQERFAAGESQFISEATMRKTVGLSHLYQSILTGFNIICFILAMTGFGSSSPNRSEVAICTAKVTTVIAP